MSIVVKVTAKLRGQAPGGVPGSGSGRQPACEPGAEADHSEDLGHPVSDGSCQRAWGSAVCGLKGASKEWIWGQG